MCPRGTVKRSGWFGLRGLVGTTCDLTILPHCSVGTSALDVTVQSNHMVIEVGSFCIGEKLLMGLVGVDGGCGGGRFFWSGSHWVSQSSSPDCKVL